MVSGLSRNSASTAPVDNVPEKCSEFVKDVKRSDKRFECQWLAKLSRSLDETVDEKTRDKIIKGSEKLADSPSEQDVINWTREAMNRLNALERACVSSAEFVSANILHSFRHTFVHGPSCGRSSARAFSASSDLSRRREGACLRRQDNMQLGIIEQVAAGGKWHRRSSTLT